MLFLYELKLFDYYPLKFEAWIFISGAFITFLLGSYTPFIAKKTTSNQQKFISNLSLGNIFTVNKYSILFSIWSFGIIGLLVSVLNWKYLIDKYGSIAGVFLNANIIYGLRVQGEIPESIPYVGALAFVSLFFAAVHSAQRGRISLISLLPFVAIILKDMAGFGRANTFLAVIMFFSTYMLTRHYLFNWNLIAPKQNRIRLLISTSLIVVIAVLSASLIKTSRGSYESFQGESSKLNNIKGGFVISPSIYLYTSSHVAVFSKYLEESKEITSFGKNTFLPIYSIISKLGLVKRPSDYQQFYNIPMASNTGTYLRELHSDFGPVGILIVPYFLGLSASAFWLKFLKKGKLIYLAILSYLFTIIGFSFLFMSTRASNLFISFLVLLPVSYFMDRLFQKVK